MLAWGLESLQKFGIKLVGKGKMMLKTLGGKATKEVGEQIGKETGDKIAAVNARQTARREAKKAYRGAVNEARRGGDSAAEEAIERHTKRQVSGNGKDVDIRYTNKDGKYYRQVNGQEPIELTSAQYQMHLDGKDAELAAQLSESADAWSFGDVKQWASENKGIATAIAVGGAVAGGMFLFGDDDDDD